MHVYAVDKSGKLRSVHLGFLEEFDIDIPETRGIDSSHEAVQVHASSSIFKARESRENNSFVRVVEERDFGRCHRRGYGLTVIEDGTSRTRHLQTYQEGKFQGQEFHGAEDHPDP